MLMENDWNELGDNLILAAAAFGAGYFLGGTWQTGVGALLVQFVIAKNLTAVLNNLAIIAKGTLKAAQNFVR